MISQWAAGGTYILSNELATREKPVQRVMGLTGGPWGTSAQVEADLATNRRCDVRRAGSCRETARRDNISNTWYPNWILVMILWLRMDSEEDNQKWAKEGIWRIECECCMLYSVQIKERGLVKFPTFPQFSSFPKKNWRSPRSSRRSSFKGPMSNWDGLKDPPLRSASYVVGMASAVYFIFDLAP